MSEKKRKIGILTFHCSNNYGAVLQAYALRSVLEQLYPMHDVQIINYRCKGTITPTAFSDIKQKKGMVGAVLHYSQINKMNRKFNTFRKKYLNLTKEYESTGCIAKDINLYDAIVSGSDQVWNLKWSDGDLVYFQDFHKEKQKKCSYAASFGFTILEKDKVELYKSKLSDFNNISVRESSGLDIVNNQLGLKAEHNIDPTLLLSDDEWSRIATEPSIKQKYILVYMVPKQASIINHAFELHKKTKLPIVILSKNLRPVNVIHKGDSSPEEFVGWFKNAEYVLTNSFHGTAFSCIFKKNLWIDLKTERGFNTRSESLIKLCGLEKNIKNNIVSISSDEWASSYGVINTEREKSRNLLGKLL